MSAELILLRQLQLSDSSFPSGSYTLSHGLETLVADRVVASIDDLAAFVRIQLLAKFGRSDLVSLLAAHAAAAGVDAIDKIVAIDGRLTASKIAADDRIGSARSGRRLAIEVHRLAPSNALTAFVAAIVAGRTAGNSAVAFGLAGSALGIDRRATGLTASAAFVSGLAAAAVRMGLIGHGAAQRVIADAGPIIIDAVDTAEGGDWQDLRPSAPQIEIALARHEAASARQFAS